jgi:polar amino acid transport system substrate-binding protein
MNCMRIFIFIIISIISISTSPIFAQDNIEIGTSYFPPYCYRDENGVISGFATEMIEDIFNQMEITYQISAFPFIRALYSLENNKIDALYTILRNENRENKFYYPEEPIIDTNWVFFISKEDENSLQFESIDDLRGKKIGLVKGSRYTKEFRDFIEEEQNFDEIANNELNFSKLAFGRVDYVLDEYNAGMKRIKKLGYDEKIIPLRDHPLFSQPIYIIFRKELENTPLVVHFIELLREYKTTNRYQILLDKYDISDG